MVTGSPAIGAAPSTMQATASGAGATGATVSTMDAAGGVDRLLAGTAWSRADVELVLQTISTLLLLYWAVTEVSDGL
ncbi:hypothetical protein EXE53_15400 [Halorubrum sp. SD626R]|uniref:hypothetical protein n=1 Tax=Halorubrum sp. SD626R TaxID=1419722 RepID=UPI0010FA0136|nr:hypothetical protein [Halorubrum sp. SD626R]TKX79548.1 hypothetical protein EXE53_15400 [Halorubrum sp. SD626R]